jgi:dihydrofolate synthase/folylpolyglutamate synthase
MTHSPHIDSAHARFQSIIQALESRGIFPDRTPSLQPMRAALEALQIPARPERTVVIAGTNGKGSVCAFLEALLLSAGQRVGLYTSPHLECTTERIRIQGQPISKDLFCALFDHLTQSTPPALGRSLSHFETLTAMAAEAFFGGHVIPPVDWAIFEVGMGGRWDATNAVAHTTCVITALGFDHQNFLGNSLLEIASNKFDIVGPRSEVITSPFPRHLLPPGEEEALDHLMQQKIQQTQSHWSPSSPVQLRVQAAQPLAQTDRGPALPEFWIDTPWGSTPLALAGARGAENAATALTTFERLGFHPAAHLPALQTVRWPGRMELLPPDPSLAPCPVYLSGDHNAQGIQSLLELLPHYPRKHLHLLVGVGKDKDLESILSPLSNLPNASLTLTETPFKGLPLAEYGSWLKKARQAEPDPWEAFRQVKDQAQPGDLILITGSLYLVGWLRKHLTGMTQ